MVHTLVHVRLYILLNYGAVCSCVNRRPHGGTVPSHLCKVSSYPFPALFTRATHFPLCRHGLAFAHLGCPMWVLDECLLWGLSFASEFYPYILLLFLVILQCFTTRGYVLSILLLEEGCYLHIKLSEKLAPEFKGAQRRSR